MKKIFSAFILIIISVVSVAQSIGLQIGGNLASQANNSDEFEGVTISTESKFGFAAGIVGEIPIGKSLSFRPELNFSQKGGSIDIPSVIEASSVLNYLELPLNVAYSIPKGNGSLFFGAGPSIGFGLSGKNKHKDLLGSGEELSTDVKFDGKSDAVDDNAHLNLMDLGGNIFAGYKLANGFFLTVGYSFGLSNISPTNGDGTIKNNGIAFKLGYMFMKGKNQ